MANSAQPGISFRVGCVLLHAGNGFVDVVLRLPQVRDVKQPQYFCCAIELEIGGGKAEGKRLERLRCALQVSRICCICRAELAYNAAAYLQ